MIRIAVVEDDDAYAQTLAGYIRRYVAESKEALACERFADGMTFLEEQRGGFDIVLLDIAMPHMNGLEAAKRLRAQDENVCIIFITTLAKYAIRGYEVNALDFLVKPVEYELFRIKLQKALAHCRRSRAETFGIVTAGELRARGSMRDIREQFLRNGFAAIRNSTLVNLAHVDGFAGGEVTVGGTVLPIARSSKAEFLQALAAWVGKE